MFLLRVLSTYKLKQRRIILRLQEEQKKAADVSLEQAVADVAEAPKIRLTTKKLLKGHINKVNSVHYSGDNRWVTPFFLRLNFFIL